MVDHSELERHTLIYGGDLFSARRLNYALFDEEQRKRILSGVAPVLRKADLAMVNLEGIITSGGYYYNLGLSTYMYRAHPYLVDVLKEVGIDIVTSGNNHTPDYGPDALLETIDRLQHVGIGYTGAGINREDAERPIYRKVGDTIVAIVAAELTYAHRYAAGDDLPGLHYVAEAFLKDSRDKKIIKHFSEKANEARKHAHVVIFSPHWDAHEEPPAVSEAMRRMARELLSAGYDAILAHGRHHALGVEVFDGKPVIYDAGNFLTDFGRRGSIEDTRGMLWQAEISRAGIHRLEGIPIDMVQNRTTLAKGKTLEMTLSKVERLSKEYDTDLRIENGRAIVDLSPGAIFPPSEPLDHLERPRSKQIRIAPTDVLHEELPRGVTQLDVVYENGIRLVGYELVTPSLLARERCSQTVVLYWTTDQPIEDGYVIHLEARKIDGGEISSKRVKADHHLPGDWMLPAPMWPPGKIIQDKHNIRLITPHGEAMAFFTGLRKRSRDKRKPPEGRLLRPLTHEGVELYAEKLVPVGQTPYSPEAPLMKKAYYKWREDRRIKLAEQQPFGAGPLYWDRLTIKPE